MEDEPDMGANSRCCQTITVCTSGLGKWMVGLKMDSSFTFNSTKG